MDAFTNILVDVDATAAVHPALARAARIARRSGARLTIVDVLTIPDPARSYLPSDLEEKMVVERRELLSRIARSVQGVRTDSKLLVGRPATVLIQEVLRSQHDLLVRSHARSQTGPSPTPFGAVDMELLRKCPCPVLLVRHGALDPHPRTVAAVNASTSEPAERRLNERIVEFTLRMADLEGGTPLLLHAWSPFGDRMVRSHSLDDAYAAYVDRAREHSAAQLAELVSAFAGRLAGIQTVLRRGRPDEVIREFVVADGVDLIVMGTVARSGIAGLLFGNTAERILHAVPCSVLAVKPEGFESPIRLEPA
jgi:universal stress protein E